MVQMNVLLPVWTVVRSQCWNYVRRAITPLCGQCKREKKLRKVKILSGYQLTSFCTSFPTYYGFEKDGFHPQNLVSW